MKNEIGLQIPELTKREYVSALLLQGLLSQGSNGFSEGQIKNLCKKAIMLTDTLIEELKRDEK